jgi:hypothetical protein
VEKSVLIPDELVEDFLFLSDVAKSVLPPCELGGGEEFLALLDVDKSLVTLDELGKDFLARPDM